MGSRSRLHLQVPDVNKLHVNLIILVLSVTPMSREAGLCFLWWQLSRWTWRSFALTAGVVADVCFCGWVCVCVRVCAREKKRARVCECKCGGKKRTKGPFIAVTHWQPLLMHLQCSQHILSQRLTHARTHTHSHARTKEHIAPLYLTEPNYRHLSVSDETKSCSIFRLMESDASLSLSSPSPPLSAFCRLHAIPRPPPAVSSAFDSQLVK